MLPRLSHLKLKQLSILLVSVSLTLSTLGATFGSIISPVIGQNAQNTDLFTGQFIPAFLGSAYDPSEAYKQMAGLPVVVYAYDTQDKIINNYVYRTQIRADGSFQAAGMANASHYGVCVPIADNDNSQPFRPPIPGPDGDGLEVVFAFNSGLYPRTPNNPNNQLGKGEELSDVNKNVPILHDDPNKQGCRTFFTSSRTVDIANHVNIFPLVPTTVLSVIIKDNIVTNGKVYDQFNTNSPYEIYAQRITLNSVQPSSCTDSQSQAANDITSDICTYGDVTKNQLANGPIIRGRSTPLIAADSSYQGATLFQAYAPKGIYAITFWRPDTRDITTAVTYLTYNGSQPLSTPYNGIAFESVVKAGDKVLISAGDTKATPKGAPTLDTNQWKLATRDFNVTKEFAWQPKPGNLNIWGITTTASSGGQSPIGGATINIGNKWFGFIDPMTRKCTTNQSGKISAWGIFLFSSACTANTDILPNTSTELSIKPSTIPLPTGDANSPTKQVNFAGVDNQSVTAGANTGPARYPFSLQSIPDQGAEINIYRGKYPIGPTAFNLTIDGRTYKHVATSGPNGKLVIPGIYFANNPMGKYTVTEDRRGGGFGSKTSSEKVLSFVIDGSTLKSPTLAMNNLGNLDLAPKQGVISTALASLNISNMFNLFHIQPILADGPIAPFTLDRDNGLRLFLDMKTIDAINPNGWFTYDAYDLTEVELRYPAPALDSGRSDYVIFNRNGVGGNHKDGMLIASDNTCSNETECGILNQECNASINPNCHPTPAQCVENPTLDGCATATQDTSISNARIVGVNLRLKTKDADQIDHELDSTFDHYKDYAKVPNTMPLTLALTFEKTDISNSTGQQSDQSMPSTLSAEWQVMLTKNDDGASPYTYQVSYEPIALTVTPPGCDFASHFWQVKSEFKELLCSGVGSVIGIVGQGMTYIATNLTTVDPLQYAITKDAWNIMRNFVNGMAIVLLLIAGTAIVLRYEPKTFSVQSVLTKLITTILLINFSILIIQFAIDVANVFSTGGYFFLINALTPVGTGPSAGNVFAGATALAAISAYVLTTALAFPGPALVAILIAILAVFLGLLYIIAKAVFFWMLRQIILVICIIVAPIALASRVLPGTQSFYTRWRTMITKTLVSQIMFAFVLALAMGMLTYASTGGGGFIESLVSIGLAIGLFYYTTKLPAQAMSALEAGVGFAVGSNVKKAALDVRKRAKDAKLFRTDRKIRGDARRKELKLDDEGKARIMTDKLKDISTSTSRIGRIGAVKKARTLMRSSALGRGAISLGTNATIAKKGYDENIRAGSGVAGIVPGRKALGLAYRGAIGLSLEDVEGVEEKARKTYLQGKRAEVRRQNPQVVEQEMETDLDKVYSDFDKRAFDTTFSIDTSHTGDYSPFVNQASDSYLTINDDGTGGSAINQAFLDTHVEKVFDNVPDKSVVHEFQRKYAGVSFNRMSEYKTWRNSFKWGSADPGGASWKAFWIATGVPGNSLTPNTALNAANTLIFKTFGNRVLDGAWAADIQKNMNAAAQGRVGVGGGYARKV